AGLEHVQGLKQLQTLFLDRGRGHGTDFTISSTLSVGRPRRMHITDAGLAYLQKLTQLKELSLYGTEITDEGLVHLAPLQQLTSLDLDGTQVSDAGLRHLTSLKNLKALHLDQTQITDQGLLQLHDLTKLSDLTTRNTQVTQQGRQAFEAYAPNAFQGPRSF